MGSPSYRWPGVGALLLIAGACTPASSAFPATPGPVSGAPSVEAALARHAANLPPVDSVVGPLQLRVSYPAEGARIVARDSSFFFGSTGTGRATLFINGQPVRVAANGAWLAWLPLPRDSVMVFELVATADGQRATERLTLRRPNDLRRDSGAWADTTSLSPTGAVWWGADQPLTLTARAAPGAIVTLRVGDSVRVPLRPGSERAEVPWGIRAFDRDSANLVRSVATDRYVGVAQGLAIGDSTPVLLEVVRGADTAVVQWPLRIILGAPRRFRLDDDPAATGATDGIVIGRAAPGATYQWFWSNGTEVVASGAVGANVRLDLAPGLHAWVPAADATPISARADAPMVGSVTLSSREDHVVARIPVSRQLPFEVVEGEASLRLTIYGAVGDVNWIRYGSASDLVRSVSWRQSEAGVELAFELSRPVWGFRTRWSRGDLLLEIRRPPVIERSAPFRGRLIVVDAGHPPGGAIGPTGLREAEANLAIARNLEALLQEAGATVIMTRVSDSAVALSARPQLADSVGADLLVSIHNNAFPDGVNPFTNNGSSVFYNHPRSIPLARAVQAALVDRLGQRDLGFARGDLALVRPTWMPAILTEGLFLMVPEQEAALRSPVGQRWYAEAVFEGMREYLRGWALR